MYQAILTENYFSQPLLPLDMKVNGEFVFDTDISSSCLHFAHSAPLKPRPHVQSVTCNGNATARNYCIAVSRTNFCV